MRSRRAQGAEARIELIDISDFNRHLHFSRPAERRHGVALSRDGESIKGDARRGMNRGASRLISIGRDRHHTE
jgi:hypothetical protein